MREKSVTKSRRSEPSPGEVSESHITVQQQTIQVTSGPLPSPEVLGLYDAISPGLASEIINAFQAEYKQRHELERIAMDGDIEAMRLQALRISRGQWLGLTIAIFGLAAGTLLVYRNHDVAGATLGAGGLASVLAAYFRSAPHSP